MKRFGVWGILLAVLVLIALVVLPSKGVHFNGQLMKNGQPIVADGKHAMQVRFYDLLDPARLAYEDLVEGTVKNGQFDVAVKPPTSVLKTPTVAVVCIKENNGGSDGAPVCSESSGSTGDYAVVCSPYYVEERVTSWTNRLFGRNKISATDSLSKCADDDKSTVGKTVNISGGFANTTITKDISSLHDQVDALQLRVDKSTPTTNVTDEIINEETSVTQVTQVTIDETGLKTLSGLSPLVVSGTGSDPLLSLATCPTNQMFVYDGSSWKCKAGLKVVAGLNITVTGSDTVTVATVNSPTFSGTVTAGTLDVNGNATVGGSLTLNGPFLPNGLAGTSGQVLVSQGNGGPPVWMNVAGVCATSDAHFCQGGNDFGVPAVLGTKDNFALNFTTHNSTKMVILPNGHVGIGTTNPTQMLQLGSLTHAGSTTPATIDLGGSFSSVAGDHLKLRLYDIGGGVAGGFGVSANQLDYKVWNAAADHVFYQGLTELVRIEGTGNVGIGTGNPGVKLDVNGTARLMAQGGLRFADTDSSNYVGFQAPGTVGTDVTWTLPGADGTNGQVLTTDGSGVLSWAAANDTSVPINNLAGATGSNSIFNGAFTQAWTWESLATGNGLVLATPSHHTGSLFEVESNTSNTLNDGIAHFNFTGNHGNAGVRIDDETQAGQAMQINTNSLTTGNALAITTNNTGFNSTNGLIYVANTGSSTNGVLARFQSNNTAGSGLTILANGNVGIGTSTPANLLDVNGNARLMAQGGLRFADADSSNYVAFRAPGTVGTDVTWTLPGADGTNGQALLTNGTGTLNWGNPTAGSMPISSLTAATATNTIDNGANTQTWNWNSLTSGTGLVLHSNNSGLNTATGLLNVANSSSSTNGALARFDANGTDAMAGMIWLTNGNVGIGTHNPPARLAVVDATVTSGTTKTGLRVEGNAFNSTKTDTDGYLAYFKNHNTGSGGFESNGLLVELSASGAGNGNYYIGFADAAGVKGAVRGTGGGVELFTASDARLKTNVSGTNYSIDDLMKLNVVEFDWKQTGDHDVGFIAQDVHKVFPKAVAPGNEDTPWMVDKSGLIPLVVKSVQDLNVKISEQAVQIEELKKAVFKGGVVAEDTTFNGLVKFEGEVRLSGKNAGSATVKAGQKSVDVVLPKSLSGVPSVTLSKNEFMLFDDYRVINKTQNGFRIELLRASNRDITFDWHAFTPE